MAIINGTSGKDELRTLGSNDELLGLEGNDILDAATGTGKNILRGGEGNDELFAYTEDELYGDKGDDILYSDGKGNNKLYGGEDNDIIFPDINDQVFGDNGDDVIYAGDGGSSFTGGIGLDIFWIANVEAPENPNTINDFASTLDKIRVDLEQINKFSDLTITQEGTDSVISAIGKKLAILKNTQVTSLNPGNILIGTDDIPDIPSIIDTKDNIFTIGGSLSAKTNLKVKLTSIDASFVNEVGFFIVKDDKGRIVDPDTGNSLTAADGDAYLKLALKQSQILLSGISNPPNGFKSNEISRIVEGIKGGDRIVFYMVQNGTTDGILANQIPSSKILLGSSFGSDAFLQLKVDNLGNGKFNFAWEDQIGGGDKDFNDMVFSLELSNESAPFGSTLQGKNSSELLDLTKASANIKADFSVSREADFNNEVYFYKVDSTDGLVGGLNPNSANQADYLQAAINNVLKDASTGQAVKFAANNQEIQTGSAVIAPGSILAPMIIVNGSLNELTDSNPNNNPTVYFPFLGVNRDRVDHIRLLGNNAWGFEDLAGGGDGDFNDVIVKMNLSIVK
ncbi:MAG: DUF4114 domain-containing protein [Methylacidiphilales bacterium]|nr:DUF4114 domain-containing protein [Candidatus Methylacidiphilales bacterium]